MRNAGEIIAAANAFRLSRALLTAVEMGVFTRLDPAPLTAGELAEALGADARAVDRLCAVLAGVDLLERVDGRWANTELAAVHLVRGREQYLGGLMHTANLWDRWSTLTQAVRSGGAVTADDVAERGHDWLEPFIAAMHARGRSQAPLDVNLLDLHDVARVLDLGGGSGVFAAAFARVKRDIQVTVFDLPEVLPITGRYVMEAGLQDRIALCGGDYRRDDIGGGYDLIFLSAIVHSNSNTTNAALIRKCAGALNPGGRVVVQDFVMDDDRVHPAGGALFALNMLVATPEGDTFTEAEIRGWMEDAGLAGVYRQDTHTGTAQVIGTKPSS